jgi:uncharacterized protein (TIGR01244 family)
MHTVKLSADVTVASQPDLSEFRDIAAEGYVALINNRPDGEDPTQPGSEAEEAAADEAGLAYAHIPMGPVTESTVRHFQSVVKGAAGPVFVHCRSGTRSANLWAIGEVLDGRMAIEDLAPLSRQIGLDLSGAAGWLRQHDATAKA